MKTKESDIWCVLLYVQREQGYLCSACDDTFWETFFSPSLTGVFQKPISHIRHQFLLKEKYYSKQSRDTTLLKFQQCKRSQEQPVASCCSCFIAYSVDLQVQVQCFKSLHLRRRRKGRRKGPTLYNLNIYRTHWACLCNRMQSGCFKPNGILSNRLQARTEKCKEMLLETVTGRTVQKRRHRISRLRKIYLYK